jgi:hypothetical protein
LWHDKKENPKNTGNASTSVILSTTNPTQAALGTNQAFVVKIGWLTVWDMGRRTFALQPADVRTF